MATMEVFCEMNVDLKTMQLYARSTKKNLITVTMITIIITATILIVIAKIIMTATTRNIMI